MVRGSHHISFEGRRESVYPNMETYFKFRFLLFTTTFSLNFRRSSSSGDVLHAVDRYPLPPNEALLTTTISPEVTSLSSRPMYPNIQAS